MGARVDTEFIVAAPNVLHERMTAHDNGGTVIALESLHRAEPRFEAPVVGFDPIVRVLAGVVRRPGYQFIDHSAQRWRPVGHDLRRLAVRAERRREEPSCRSGVAS